MRLRFEHGCSRLQGAGGCSAVWGDETLAWLGLREVIALPLLWEQLSLAS